MQLRNEYAISNSNTNPNKCHNNNGINTQFYIIYRCNILLLHLACCSCFLQCRIVHINPCDLMYDAMNMFNINSANNIYYAIPDHSVTIKRFDLKIILADKGMSEWPCCCKIFNKSSTALCVF